MGLDSEEDFKACSICLDPLHTTMRIRSHATLLCGHQFHLDCIGSAFNMKGKMQCPNCRKVEKGRWLYATANRPFYELNGEDWVPEDEFYDQSYSEMYGVQWRPLSSFTRHPPTSFEEGEYLSTTTYEQQTLFAEYTAAEEAASSSSATHHPCPYIAAAAYFGSLHPFSDVSSFSDNMHTSYAFPPTIDLHYPHFENPSSTTYIDHPPIPFMPHRATSASYGPPFLVARSGGRGGGGSSINRPPPNSIARTRERMQALQAYFQPSNAPAHGPRRSISHRAGGQMGPPSDQTRGGGFYYLPSSSGQSDAAAENIFGPSGHVERDSIAGWGPFHHPGGGGSDTSRFQQRYGSEWMPSQNWA